MIAPDARSLDCAREWRAPFSPSVVVAECAEVLAAYNIRNVSGDRYSGEFVRERFREHRITYEPSEKSKSEIYGEFLPMLNSSRVELLDDSRMIAQFLVLDRRTTRGSKVSIDHPVGGKDDVANAVAGALLLVKGPAIAPFVQKMERPTIREMLGSGQLGRW